MAYVTAQELADYCRNEISADLTQFTSWAAAASNIVEDYCGRTFVVPAAGASATTRYYVPKGDVVFMHDISATTGLIVTEDGTTVSSADYQLEPRSGIDFAGRAVPYTRIVRLDTTWYADGRETTVGVTSAYWGWPAVPDRVTEATLIIGKDLAHGRETRFGVAGFGEFGVVRQRMEVNPLAAVLLDSLIRTEFTVGVA